MPDNQLIDFVRRAEARLAGAGIDNPALDARLLMAHVLGCDRAQLLSQSERALTDDEKRRIEELVERRIRREPVSRILGMREFWGLPFGLNPATLDPRPESETLIEAVLKNLPSHEGGGNFIRILDLGTGSGCLLLALLHELPSATGLGVDCTPRAVEQAQKNAEQLELAARASFKINNWADGLEEKFDIVISNPPYITGADIPDLMPEVRDFDPLLALDGGADGLDVYRLLIPQLPGLLKPNGFAVFEIGIGQGVAVRKLFKKTGFQKIAADNDLGGIERSILASNAG